MHCSWCVLDCGEAQVRIAVEKEDVCNAAATGKTARTNIPSPDERSVDSEAQPGGATEQQKGSNAER